MPCYHPLNGYLAKEVNAGGKRNVVFNLSRGYVDRPVTLPCGQCLGCRLERSRQWAIRCVHEASLHSDNCFVTLTYADEHLPLGSSLKKREFQLFMKRLRKRHGAGIRFYGCGEYGEENARPHYHVCLFNYDPSDKILFSVRKKIQLYKSADMDDLWGKGGTRTGDLTFESAAYVARYIMKKITGPGSASHYETVDPGTGEIINREPEFTTMSRGGKYQSKGGIGKAWYDQYSADVYNHDFVVFNGKKMRSPRYYDRQFELKNPVAYKRLRNKRLAKAKNQAADNTPDRLRVREKVSEAKLEKLPRNLE